MPGGTPSRAARLLLAGAAVDAFGTGLTVPLLVVYLHGVRGVAMETVGLLAAVPPAVGLVLLGPVGILVDRIGPRRVQMASLVAATAGAMTMAFVDSVPLAFAARVLTGIGIAAFWPANQSLIADLVPSAERQRLFGVWFALFNFGIGIGGVAAGAYVDVARPETFTVVYAVDALTFLVPLALLGGPLRTIGGPVAHVHAVEDAGSYRAVLADRVFRRYLAVVVVATFVGYGQIEAGWMGYANVVAQVTPRALGAAFAVNTAIIVVLQLVVLRLIDGRRRTRMIMVQAALWAASWVIFGLAGLVPATDLAAGLVIGGFGVFAIGETLQSPIGPAIVNDVAPERLRGRYNAAAGLAFQAAAIIAPSIAGFLLGAGRGGAFIAMLVVGCGALAIAAARLEGVLSPHANGVAPAPVALDERASA